MCHILIGLFTFYFAQNCILLGAQSITSGGSLILNQAFPRSLLPLSSAISAAKQFLPTIPIYVLIVLGGKIFLNETSLPGLSLNYLLLPILFLNPLGPILSANSRIWIDGQLPTLAQLIGCISWALISFLMGSYFFISRERDFAVRI